MTELDPADDIWPADAGVETFLPILNAQLCPGIDAVTGRAIVLFAMQLEPGGPRYSLDLSDTDADALAERLEAEADRARMINWQSGMIPPGSPQP